MTDAEVAPVISAVSGALGQALGLSPATVQLVVLALGILVPILVRYLEKRALVPREAAAAIVRGVEDSTPPNGAVRQAIARAAAAAGVSEKVDALVQGVVEKES